MRSEILPKLFLHHRFVMGPVADVHLGNKLAFEGNDVCANSIKEPAVVGDDEGKAANYISSVQQSCPKTHHIEPPRLRSVSARQGEIKRRTLSHFAFDPDPATVNLDYFLHKSKTDSCAFALGI